VTTILQLIRQLFTAFRWWVIIQPWEQAVRCRLGKHVRTLGPGIHLRLPFIDAVFIQSIRRRMLHLPTQTVATKDGKTVTLGGAAAYEIADVRKLYETLHDAAGTIENLCLCAIAEVVATHQASECLPIFIGNEATKLVKFEDYGLGGAQICVTDFAFVKTFRLINDQRWSRGGSLDTSGAPAGTPN
jgi:regulator of protease activity HflC (stomatin/prohibitin superfamily)